MIFSIVPETISKLVYSLQVPKTLIGIAIQLLFSIDCRCSLQLMVKFDKLNNSIKFFVCRKRDWYLDIPKLAQQSNKKIEKNWNAIMMNMTTMSSPLWCPNKWISLVYA